MMYVPSCGEIKQVGFDSKGIRILLISIGIFLFINLGFFVYNIVSIPRFARMEKVRMENNRLRAELDNIGEKLDSSRVKLEALARLEGNFRLMEGLEPVSDTSGVIGFGGPQLRLSDDDYKTKSIVELKGKKLSYTLDSLLMQAEFHLSSYSEICSSAAKSKSILDRTPSIKPMEGYISSVFGYRTDPFTGQRKLHEGIDIVAPRGTPIYATADGVVTFTGWYHGYGKLVRINHKYYETRYGHMDRIDVRRGQRVKRGEQIGTCGKTGRATALHVHYEVRINGNPTNPEKYILPEHAIVD